MNLRDIVKAYLCSVEPELGVDNMIEEIKQWALECVGEDTHENLPEPDERDNEEGYNEAKQEIRQRIEESTK